jgi:pyridoxine 4-dehydrogenase
VLDGKVVQQVTGVAGRVLVVGGHLRVRRRDLRDAAAPTAAERPDVLDVVNLWTAAGTDDRLVVPGTLTPQVEALAEPQQQGLIRHLGLSTVSLDELAEAQRIAPVVCAQNFLNIANRADEAVLAATAGKHIAYVPYFPLGSFSPLRCWSRSPSGSARCRWRSPSPCCYSTRRNIMLIPGTSSVGHLPENVAGAALALPPDAAAELHAI